MLEHHGFIWGGVRRDHRTTDLSCRPRQAEDGPQNAPPPPVAYPSLQRDFPPAVGPRPAVKEKFIFFSALTFFYSRPHLRYNLRRKKNTKKLETIKLTSDIEDFSN
ncbi:hypothetical protein CEXT_9681 [Caerostris extrusa]|uniref:Uncharacterized protein n=1 Tax=Caerostris extrusa TaxID=172846 RepID=A0AAV4TKD1_CAEEX|nr:hypothetical protein CEXT_9681 [Caerostris extrusa]